MTEERREEKYMSEIVGIETRGSAHVLAPISSDVVQAQEVSISTWVGMHKYIYI